MTTEQSKELQDQYLNQIKDNKIIDDGYQN
jgi:sRNA-binding regulator protein Hfq